MQKEIYTIEKLENELMSFFSSELISKYGIKFHENKVLSDEDFIRFTVEVKESKLSKNWLNGTILMCFDMFMQNVNGTHQGITKTSNGWSLEGFCSRNYVK